MTFFLFYAAFVLALAAVICSDPVTRVAYQGKEYRGFSKFFIVVVLAIMMPPLATVAAVKEFLKQCR